MELREYLFRHEIPKGKFAKEIGVAEKTLWSILKGKYDVRLSIAIDIERATKRHVRCQDLNKTYKRAHEVCDD